MKVMNKNLLAALAAASLMAGSAQANTITGSYWHVSESVSQSATIANIPGTTPDVTFDVNSPLDFDSRSGGNNSAFYTVGAWLGTGGAFNVIENTSGTLASTLDYTGTGSFLAFEGVVTVSNGQMFSVAHDDGLTLEIGGLTVINQPGPTSPTTSTGTYSGPDGTYAFKLAYGECCGAPAVLKVDLPFSNVPDGGSTLAMLGGALAMMGAVSRRFRK